jgi:hypothetical protein
LIGNQNGPSSGLVLIADQVRCFRRRSADLVFSF